jgi:hypothetical protein
VRARACAPAHFARRALLLLLLLLLPTILHPDSCIAGIVLLQRRRLVCMLLNSFCARGRGAHREGVRHVGCVSRGARGVWDTAAGNGRACAEVEGSCARSAGPAAGAWQQVDGCHHLSRPSVCTLASATASPGRRSNDCRPRCCAAHLSSSSSSSSSNTTTSSSSCAAPPPNTTDCYHRTSSTCNARTSVLPWARPVAAAALCGGRPPKQLLQSADVPTTMA